MHKNKGGDRGRQMGRKNQKPETKDQELDSNDLRMDMREISKRIELLGSSHMTWKERKELENKKVVALGGKPPKKQRLPLSIARVVMKKQKDREQKQLQENVILGRFGGKSGGGSKRSVEKRRPEDRVLRASEGYFKNGVLDVKHLLRPTSSRDRDAGAHVNFSGPKKGGGKKGGGKNKGKKGGKKRH
ncbi:hypothetical protein ABKV19_004494 [Rosa sericea]|uniref:Axoneme-associated protein MST101(2) protein n=1 Tax=Rosa chinensis TaxID=74649 RepID=A0A2P6QE37_ROSCH|nr:uncharacterized protein LOC112168491 [Rosa chinensis]PRQ32417.1 hypothetical protein RchiOBHm_Chr5g0046151 [Rosa chinensis]